MKFIIMIKIFWYLVSITTILLIIFHNPIGNNNNIIGSNQVFNMGSNQEVMIKWTMFSILLFFILTIISVNLFIS